MTKKELIASASRKSGMSKIQMSTALSSILATISESLAKEESVQLIGFGTFSIKQFAARAGINPTTKEPIVIPAKKGIRFKASKSKK